MEPESWNGRRIQGIFKTAINWAGHRKTCRFPCHVLNTTSLSNEWYCSSAKSMGWALGRVIIESMACGTVVVASVGGIPEILTGSFKVGFLPGNVQDFVDICSVMNWKDKSPISVKNAVFMFCTSLFRQDGWRCWKVLLLNKDLDCPVAGVPSTTTASQMGVMSDFNQSVLGIPREVCTIKLPRI